MAVWGARQAPIRPSPLGALLAAVVTLGALGGAALAQSDGTKPPKVFTPVAPPITCASVAPVPTGAPADATGTATLVPAVPSLAAVCAYGPQAAAIKQLNSQQAAAVVALLNNAPSTPSARLEPSASCLAASKDVVVPGDAYLLTLRYGTRPDVTVRLVPTPSCEVFAATGQKTAQVSTKVLAYLV